MGQSYSLIYPYYVAIAVVSEEINDIAKRGEKHPRTNLIQLESGLRQHRRNIKVISQRKYFV